MDCIWEDLACGCGIGIDGARSWVQYWEGFVEWRGLLKLRSLQLVENCAKHSAPLLGEESWNPTRRRRVVGHESERIENAVKADVVRQWSGRLLHSHRHVRQPSMLEVSLGKEREQIKTTME